MKTSRQLFFVLMIFNALISNAQDGTDPCSDPFQPLGYNRTINGDFEAGPVGFGSDLMQSSVCSPNSYWVFAPAELYCALTPIPDITPNGGSYLSVVSTFEENQFPAIWRQDVFLAAGQQYTFSYWVNNVTATINDNPVINPTPGLFLSVNFNGQAIEQGIDLNSEEYLVGGWQKVCVSFTSPVTGYRVISLEQEYITGGTLEETRFLLDDINFNPIYETVVANAEGAQLMVQYEPGTTEAEQAAIRAEANAILVDSCACGDVDLWLITQFPVVIDGDTIFDIENLREKSKKKAEIESVDYNYYAFSHNYNNDFSYDSQKNIYYQQDDYSELSSDSCDVVVAIIDTGIDYTHEDLKDYMWDACFPCACPLDGNKGYDYAMMITILLMTMGMVHMLRELFKKNLQTTILILTIP